jgi:hypothetical protein
MATVYRLSNSTTFGTIRAAYLAIGTLTQDEILEVETADGEDVGEFWTNGAFENLSPYTLTVRGRNGYGVLKSNGVNSSVFIENMNNVVLERLSLKNGGTMNLRLKNCTGIYANDLLIDSASYSIYVENCTSVEVVSATCTNSKFEPIYLSNSLGITLNSVSIDLASTVVTSSAGLRATNIEYLDIINLTSLNSKITNHFKITTCKNVNITRCNLKNSIGHAIYGIASDLKVTDNLLWNNGLVTDGTSAVFCEGCNDIYMNGNTVKHIGSPNSYILFCRDNTTQVREFNNNICLLETANNTTGSVYYLRLELSDLVSSWSNLSCDNNLYYSSNPSIKFARGRIGGTVFTYSTLAAFQSGQGKELQSIISNPIFLLNSFILDSSSRGYSEGNYLKSTLYTQDFKLRPSTIDIGAYCNNATTPVFSSITPTFIAIDRVTSNIFYSGFTIPAYNEVLFISNSIGIPNITTWNISGTSSMNTIGKYKMTQWNLNSNYGSQYNVSTSAYKKGLNPSSSTLTYPNHVTVIRRYPVPKFSLNSENLIYTGNTVNFNNDSIEGDSYVWKISDSSNNIISSAITSSMTYQFNSSGVYNVNLSAINTTGTRDILSKNIIQVTTEDIVPKLNIVSDKEIVRKGGSVNFSAVTPNATSDSPNPTVTYPNIGSYDVYYSATIGNKLINTFFRRKVTCVPVLTGTTIHDVIFTSSTQIRIIDTTINGVTVNAGDLIRVQGTGDQLRFRNIIGNPSKPIIITNVGLVTLNTISGFSSLRLEDNCAYIILDGKGDPNYEYGFYLTQPTSNANGSGGLLCTNKATDIEVFGVEIYNSGFAGIMAKTDDASTPRSEFTMKNLKIHHNYIHGIRGEGMYLGHFTWNTDNNVAAGYLAPEMWDTKVYKNKVWHTGNDGIQLGCGVQGSEIHDNDIQFTGEFGSGGQNSCISVNSGFVGYVYNNKCIAAPKGGSIVIQPHGNTYIFNNTFSGMVDSTDGIYGISDATTGLNIEVYIFNNTVLGRRNGMVYNYQGGNKWGKLVMLNNIFTLGSGSSNIIYYGTTPLTNIISDKNIYKTYGDTDSLLFYDQTNGDLRVGPNSIALATDGADLTQHISLPWNTLTDQFGLILPLNVGWGYGAFSIKGVNQVSDATNTKEGIFYKIYCTNPDGWQYGFVTDESFILPNVAPNLTGTTVEDTLTILKDTRNKTPLPTKKYEEFGKRGEIRYGNNYMHVCIQDGVWLSVPLASEVSPTIWDNIQGKPDSSVEDIDEAVLNMGLIASKNVDGTDLMDKSTLVYNFSAQTWTMKEYGVVGSKSVDETGLSNGVVPKYNSTTQKYDLVSFPTAGVFTQGSGTLLSFSSNKIYGTPSLPESGNITFDTNGAVLGTKVKLLHKSIGTIPTLPLSAKILSNSGLYDSDNTGNINIIDFDYINDNNIQYKITQSSVGSTPDPVTLLSGLTIYFNADDLTNSSIRVSGATTFISSWGGPIDTIGLAKATGNTINQPVYYSNGGANNKGRVVFTAVSGHGLSIGGNNVKFGSISYWMVFKTPTAVNNANLFGQSAPSAGDEFRTYMNGTTAFSQRASFSVNQIATYNSNWNVLKVTHDGTTIVANLNGTQAYTQSRTKSGFGTNPTMAIGAIMTSGGTFTNNANLEVGTIILAQTLEPAKNAVVDEMLRIKYNLY